MNPPIRPPHLGRSVAWSLLLLLGLGLAERWPRSPEAESAESDQAAPPEPENPEDTEEILIARIERLPPPASLPAAPPAPASPAEAPPEALEIAHPAPIETEPVTAAPPTLPPPEPPPSEPDVPEPDPPEPQPAPPSPAFAAASPGPPPKKAEKSESASTRPVTASTVTARAATPTAPARAKPTSTLEITDVDGVPLRVRVPRDPAALDAHLRQSGGCIVVSRLEGGDAAPKGVPVAAFRLEQGRAVAIPQLCGGVYRNLDATTTAKIGDPAQNVKVEGRLITQVVLSPGLSAQMEATLAARFPGKSAEQRAELAAEQQYTLVCIAQARGGFECS